MSHWRRGFLAFMLSSCTALTLPTHAPLFAMASGSSATLSLRVDVQNLPRAALAAGHSGHMTVRVPSDLALEELKQTLQDRLSEALFIELNSHTPLAFDIEVYHARSDRFEPLETMDQLVKSKRSRLNLVLHASSDTKQQQGECLALPARMFAVDTRIGAFRINGHAVYIDEVENSGLGTGLTTWDGSVVLAKYLEHQSAIKPGSLHDKRVLELGAGTGLVGLSAALLEPKEVILTDLPYTMANLQHNIDRTLQAASQLSTAVTARVLDWFSPSTDLGDVDVVLASDVVWVEELIPPLVNTMHTIVEASRVPTTILMSHQQRSVVSDELLFRELEKRGFERREVPTQELHPRFISDKIHVWEITRRRDE